MVLAVLAPLLAGHLVMVRSSRQGLSPPRSTLITLAPTPMGVELELRGVIREVKPKKVVLDISLIAAGVTCAKGHMVAVKMPESMLI